MRQIRITIMVILAFFTSYNCIASDRVIKRIQNKIYLVENEDSSEIDETNTQQNRPFCVQ